MTQQNKEENLYKKMKVLNFGSLNIDHVYSVDHIVRPGETINASKTELFPGGKGLNQSIALAHAGADVYHAGLVGEDDGDFLMNVCHDAGVHTELIRKASGQSGHTIIQVDARGQNSIVVFGGTNRKISREYIDSVLSSFQKGDIILLQNEINNLSYLIDRAYDRKMVIVLNPSPFDDQIKACRLDKVSVFLMNEVEGEQITGEKDPDRILAAMQEKYPEAKTVLTLGKEGSAFSDAGGNVRQKSFPVDTIDTTAAGDTFTGFFIFGLIQKMTVSDALGLASKAASVAVTRKGAAASIPMMDEIK